MVRRPVLSLVLTLSAVFGLAGCGKDSGTTSAVAVVEAGEVVLADPLTDNENGWFDNGNEMTFSEGQYVWRRPLTQVGATSGADALAPDMIPASVQASATVNVVTGASTRGILCRSSNAGGGDLADKGYELLIDGRRALIRRLEPRTAPEVLARADHSTPNGTPVRLTAQCVEDGGGGLLLALLVDGTEVLRTTVGDPLPATGDAAAPVFSGDIRAYTRPDSKEPVELIWSDWELRAASLAADG